MVFGAIIFSLLNQFWLQMAAKFHGILSKCCHFYHITLSLLDHFLQQENQTAAIKKFYENAAMLPLPFLMILGNFGHWCFTEIW